MFNSTLTENDDYLCPADGAIMITGQFMYAFLPLDLMFISNLIQ